MGDLDRLLNAVPSCDLALRLGGLIGVLFREEPWSYVRSSRVRQAVVFSEFPEILRLSQA